jgi:hypothetical protein
MRTLVCPDIHEEITTLERLLADAGPCDKTVFLGDFYDSFNRTTQTTVATLNWLLENHARPDYEFLYGNHDLPYAFPGIRELLCSGHSMSTAQLLREHPEIWKNFKLHTGVDGWLITHAGVHPKAICLDDLDACCESTLIGLASGTAGHAVRAGWARGGNQEYGGLTWLDWNDEFEPIEGVKQIVGHSRGDEPRWKGDNVCIDCDLKYYAIIEDGKLTVHPTEAERIFRGIGK